MRREPIKLILRDFESIVKTPRAVAVVRIIRPRRLENIMFRMIRSVIIERERYL